MAYIDVGKFVNFIRNSNMEKQDKNTVLVAMQLQPTADVVEVKHGEWLEVDSDVGWELVRCSLCGKEQSLFQDEEKPLYCPNCGAKMDGGEAE